MHHYWRYARVIHPAFFLSLAIIFGALSIAALRHNNQQMIKLRDAVYQADQQGGDVEGALLSLRQYVFSHMNTSLASGPNAVHPPIQLKYTYERLQAAQQQQLGQDHSEIYGQAQKTCEQQNQGGTTQSMIACIQSYTAAHGIQLTPIPEGLYKFDFVSAKWSPDLAGWSIVAAIFFTLAFIIASIYRWMMKKLL